MGTNKEAEYVRAKSSNQAISRTDKCSLLYYGLQHTAVISIKQDM